MLSISNSPWGLIALRSIHRTNATVSAKGRVGDSLEISAPGDASWRPADEPAAGGARRGP
jgi:hypothetical protein